MNKTDHQHNRKHNHTLTKLKALSVKERSDDQTVTRKNWSGRDVMRESEHEEVKCLLSPSSCLSFEIEESRLYYWTPVPVPANDLGAVIDLFNAHFIAGNPPPRIFQKADRVVIGNLLAQKEENYCSEITST